MNPNMNTPSPFPTILTITLTLAAVLLLSACQRPPQTTPTPLPPAPQTPPPPTRRIPTDSPIVRVSTGDLQGVSEHGVYAFKGIPYAAPPVGDLRWREPQPPQAWEGVRPAVQYGHSCFQIDSSDMEGAGDPGPMSEDCLYLNVWMPDLEPDEPLPVLVWIHGGGLVIGAGSLPVFTGAPLASRDAVIVTLNYRLGPLGFFAHPALEAENPGGPVNFGLLDQIAALKWVQENIAAFGGDPDNVTIFGQSAGAQSVLALYTSPLAQGLFHKGIVQSAYGVLGNSRARAIQAGIQTANDLGLDGERATMDQLRALPAADLGALQDPLATLTPSFVIGDPVLPRAIFKVFQAGEEAPLPLIIGSNSNEASVLQAFGLDPAILLEHLGMGKLLLRLFYFGGGSDSDLASKVIRDLIFTSYAKRIADWHSRYAPVWRYYFSYVPENLRDEKSGPGHGDELVFVFDTMDFVPNSEIYTDGDKEMARRMGSYWLAFARSGVPNPEGEPTWPQVNPRKDRLLEFGETIRVRANFMRRRLNFYIWLVDMLDRFAGREAGL